MNINEMTKDEILGKLSEMSKSVHSTPREMEHLDESDGFLDDVREMEALFASIQKNSQNVENDSKYWVLLSIITVALFSFAILIKGTLISEIRDFRSHSS